MKKKGEKKASEIETWNMIEMMIWKGKLKAESLKNI